MIANRTKFIIIAFCVLIISFLLKEKFNKLGELNNGNN